MYHHFNVHIFLGTMSEYIFINHDWNIVGSFNEKFAFLICISSNIPRNIFTRNKVPIVIIEVVFTAYMCIQVFSKP